MAINVSVRWGYYHWGTRLNAMNMFLSFQPMIPPKRFDIFSPCVGCSDGLDAFKFFFEHSLPLFFSGTPVFGKKNTGSSRFWPLPPQNVKTFRWDHRLQR